MSSIRFESMSHTMPSPITPSKHLVIFTPHALTIDNGIPHTPTDTSNAFSEWLAGKAQTELNLFSVATKSVGGANLDETFENFLQALEVADCAIIVIPGKQICLLDAIYPRLLVHLTFRPWWLKRMLVVSLGEMANNGKKFDSKIFTHPPVIFSSSPKKWEKAINQWREIAEFIHPPAIEEQTLTQNTKEIEPSISKEKFSPSENEINNKDSEEPHRSVGLPLNVPPYESNEYKNSAAMQLKLPDGPKRNRWGKVRLATTSILLIVTAYFLYKSRLRI